MAISLTPKSGKDSSGRGGNEGKHGRRQRRQGRHHHESAGYRHLLSLIGQGHARKRWSNCSKPLSRRPSQISLHSLIASTPKKEAPAGAQLNNDPPKIFVGYRPSILLSVNGEPVLSEVPNTNLKFVANTQWPLFFDSGNSTYYLAVGQQWLAANSLDGQWSATKKLPPDMSKVPQDKQWSALKKFIPPSAKSGGRYASRFLQRQAGRSHSVRWSACLRANSGHAA